ncbi:small G protein signaling modulator 1-like isoform X3 [Gordionus sp. m RMFG-2023]|uniref:small G protein signaling modulator 1-like isoform X3 n=1 Tax=Gordionus sp. m RMFG-2023 TaxID=3053472 RepID=UPI0031FC8C17
MAEDDEKEKLINMVKKQVKLLMEEAVAKKIIYEDSSSVLALCAVIDVCLSHGLKRRAVGLFRTNTTTALLHKLAKKGGPAAALVKILNDEKTLQEASKKMINNANRSDSGVPPTPPLSSGIIIKRFPFSYSRSQSSSTTTTNTSSSSSSSSHATVDTSPPPPTPCSPFINTINSTTSSTSHTFHSNSMSIKYTWIKTALVHKQLTPVVEQIEKYASDYYERFALAADPALGPLLLTLIAGPALALKYIPHNSTSFPFRSSGELSASELIERSKVKAKRDGCNHNPTHDYSDSQCYGKNNVVTGTTGEAGYLALKTEINCGDRNNKKAGFKTLRLEWTPNALLEKDEKEHDKRPILDDVKAIGLKRFWASSNDGGLGISSQTTRNGYNAVNNVGVIGDKKREKDREGMGKEGGIVEALSVDLREVLYVHCHQKSDSNDSIILIRHDGVQIPPLFFPKGSHLLTFLACLENCLAPNFKLDPPLWDHDLKGKIFPKFNPKNERGKKKEIIGKMIKMDSASKLQRHFFFSKLSEENKSTDHLTHLKKLKTPRSLDSITGPDASPIDKEWQSDAVADFDYIFRIISNQDSKHIQEVSIESVENNGDIRGNQFVYPSIDKYESDNVFLNGKLNKEIFCVGTNDLEEEENELEGDGRVENAEIGNNIKYLCHADEKLNTSSQTISINDNATSQDKKLLLARESMQQLCETMKKQITTRAFIGWLSYCKHIRAVRNQLSHLVYPWSRYVKYVEREELCKNGLTKELLTLIQDTDSRIIDPDLMIGAIYMGGVQDNLREKIWPFLLEYYHFSSTTEERTALLKNSKQSYEYNYAEWAKLESFIKERDKEIAAIQLQKMTEKSFSNCTDKISCTIDQENDANISGDNNLNTQKPLNRTHTEESLESSNGNCSSLLRRISNTSLFGKRSSLILYKNTPPPNNKKIGENIDKTQRTTLKENNQCKKPENTFETITSFDEVFDKSDQVNGTASPLYPTPISIISSNHNAIRSPLDTSINGYSDQIDSNKHISPSKISNLGPFLETSRDFSYSPAELMETTPNIDDFHHMEDIYDKIDDIIDIDCNSTFNDKNRYAQWQQDNDTLFYPPEVIDNFALNIHRIDKDVLRCDRNYWYFENTHNLDKLRNVICSYVWKNLECGYFQGMCDLAAPLLVIFDEEVITYECFSKLMEKMSGNFPMMGNNMDDNFSYMASLIQVNKILDPEMHRLMQKSGEYTNFYFCYRWFLLDFKRELTYEDIFLVWETIWAARFTVSNHFVLFMALAFVEYYRVVIIDNEMEFTDKWLKSIL